MSMRWLVPIAAASCRRLRPASPCSATYDIASRSSRSRAGCSVGADGPACAFRVSTVPSGTCTRWYRPERPSDRPLEGGVAMKRRDVRVTAHTDATPDVVYGLLADGNTW